MIVISVSEISTSFDPSGVCADFLIGGCQGPPRDGDHDYAQSDDGHQSDDVRHDDVDVGGALVFYLQEADWRKPIPEIAPTPPTNPANTAKTLVFTMSIFVLLYEPRMCKICVLVKSGMDLKVTKL